MNAENRREQPLSLNDLIEKERLQEELVKYEAFGVRGFTWFLPYMKETVAQPEFQARIARFQETPTPEDVAYFHAWSGEIMKIVAALSKLSRANLWSNIIPTATFSYHDQRMEVEADLDECWNACL